MRNLIGTAAVVLAVLAAGSAGARTYTLHEAMLEAVQASDAVAAATARTDQEKARADAALLMFFPAATLSGGYSRLDSTPYTETTLDITEMLPDELLENELFGQYFEDIEPATMRIEFGRQDNIQLQLQAEQIIFAGTGLHRQRAMAVAQLSSAREEERVARHEAAMNAEKTFWQMALARESVSVTDAAIETAETHIALLESFVQVGMASQSDMMAARVQLASLKFERLRARQGASLAENAFRMWVHVPDDVSIELDLDGGTAPLRLPENRDAVIDLARDSRPEIKMLGYQHDSARHGAGAAWSSWLPAVVFRANMYLKNPDRSNEPNFYWSGDLTIGLQWRLWDRGTAITTNRQARAGMRQIEAYRRQLSAGIKLEIEQALAQRREATEQMLVADEAVALAHESLRLSQLNLGEGMARNVDVLEAQTQLSKAQLDRLFAETNFRLAEANLRRAIGLDLEGM